MNSTLRVVGVVLLLLLSACGGGGSSPPPLTSPPTTPPQGTIGPTGGTVNGPNGAQVVIPPGALSSNVVISIQATSAGAPPLPGGFTVAGSTYALLPHGTTFAVPVTITLPYSASSIPAGSSPALYKTNASMTGWDPVTAATFSANTVSAQISSFSFAEVVVPPLAHNDPNRDWFFFEYRNDGLGPLQVANESQTGGDLHELYDFGPATFSDLDGDSVATGEIFSSASGVTFWVTAQAPSVNRSEMNSVLGDMAQLKQSQSFKKNAADAKLQLVLTEASIDLLDYNADPVPNQECPWASGDIEKCGELIKGSLYFDAVAFLQDNPFFHTAGVAEVFGFHGHLDLDAYTLGAGNIKNPLWQVTTFLNVYNEVHGLLRLQNPLTLNVDLTAVPVGEEFTVLIDTSALAINRRGLESSVYTHLRDPLKVGGATIVTTGLTPTNHPVLTPPPAPLPPACATANPAAGTLQFSASNFSQAEFGGARPTIVVTRSGGSVGEVSANFSTSDGTAVAGADYTATNTAVVFGDGDTSPRRMVVPLIYDQVAEPDETVQLTLSSPRGCAAIGTQSTATLTILDDDRPPPPVVSFTVGGTVTGLSGTGLLLRNAGLDLPINANGAFTFPTPMATGMSYNVTVATHPASPTQICTVTNGSGVIASTNVTNVAVNCVTPPPVGSLDATFGASGKVNTAISSGHGEAIALQSNGKIIVAGKSLNSGSTDFLVARYTTTGALDTTFGTNGIANITFVASIDEAFDVAVQLDDKIVVVGRANNGSGTNYDFAVARLLPDGALDTSFDGDGKLTTDFGSGADYAQAVAIQTDGKIVVAGHTTIAGGNDFAVARYNDDGSLDTSFDADGKVTTNVSGNLDFAYAVAIQSDGKIVVGGYANNDFALVRYTSGGALDTTFDGDGKVTTHLSGGGGSDRVNALAIQGDGKIVAAGNAGGDFGLARYNMDGALDSSFGTGGKVLTDFNADADYAEGLSLQTNGAIVVVGRTTTSTIFDLAVVRYLSNGTLDSSFATNGKLVVDFFGSGDFSQDVAIQPDGKIVATGYSTNGANTDVTLVRVNP